MKSQEATKSKSNPAGVRLGLLAPADLQAEVQKLQLAIAVRAHEFFEARGEEHGHDLDDWLRAKSELLCPVSFAMSESKDRLSIRANVAGFDQNEIEVSVEPSRITILGRKKDSKRKTERGVNEGSGSHSDQILEVIDLATEVAPERTIVELQAGELTFELPVAPKNTMRAQLES
jgi:HSP20 family molecular chaperone IbpA